MFDQYQRTYRYALNVGIYKQKNGCRNPKMDDKKVKLVSNIWAYIYAFVYVQIKQYKGMVFMKKKIFCK